MTAVTKPPFFLTYWNPFSKKDPGVVDGFLRYIKDISLVDYASNTIGKYLEKTSQSQITAINNIGNKIYGIQSKSYDQLIKLNQSMFNISANLKNISADLQDIGYSLSSLDQRMSILLDQTRISNILNYNIAELLRIPDSQKERQHNIELGLKFFHNARKDKDLYKDSIKYLLLAEEKMPEDYFVLHRIGMIYLFVPELLNLEKATEYFLKAAKYSLAESYTDSISSKNILSLDIGIPFNKQLEKNDIKQLCIECYINASTALYALCDFNSASDTITKAINIDRKKIVLKLLKAKYLIREGEDVKASELVNDAIESEPSIINYVYADLDLISSLKIISVIDKYSEKISEKISNLKDKIKNSEIISPTYKDRILKKINIISSKIPLYEKEKEIYEIESDFNNEGQRILSEKKKNENKQKSKILHEQIEEKNKILKSELKAELIQYSLILKLVNSEILYYFLQNILDNYEKTSLDKIYSMLKKTNLAKQVCWDSYDKFAFCKKFRYLITKGKSVGSKELQMRFYDIYLGERVLPTKWATDHSEAGFSSSYITINWEEKFKSIDITYKNLSSTNCDFFEKNNLKKINFLEYSEFYNNIYCLQPDAIVLKMRFGSDIYSFLKKHLNDYLFSMLVLSVVNFILSKNKKNIIQIIKKFNNSITITKIKSIFESSLEYSLDNVDTTILITEGLKIFSNEFPELINDFKQILFKLAIEIEISDCGYIVFGNKLLKNEHNNLVELKTILNLKMGKENNIHSFLGEDMTNDIFSLIVSSVVQFNEIKLKKLSSKEQQVFKDFHLSIGNKLIKKIFESSHKCYIDINNKRKLIIEGLIIFSEHYPELVNEFKMNLYNLAVEISKADSDFLDFGKKISKNEQKNLEELKTILEIV